MRAAPSLVAVAVTALIATSCTDSEPVGAPEPPPPGPKTAVVGAVDEPTSFNVNHPAQATATGRDVAGLVWPSAYRISPDSTPEPWLVSAPAAVVTTDPFVVEWRIRPDADWSDGTPVSADDFEYLYRHCAGLVPDATCADTAGYDRVTDFEAIDDKTVRLTFDSPYAEYESLFRDIPPSHLATERPDAWGRDFVDGPGASAGPYELVSWTAGESMLFERNDDYFGSTPEIERLTIRFVDAASQVGELRNGEVHVIAPEADAATLDTLTDSSGITVEVGPSRDLEMLAFNLDNPFLAQAPVRRAIALATDRQVLVESLVLPVDQDARRLDSHVFAVDQPGYEAHGEEFRSSSLDLARAELESAGFERSEDGFYQLDGQPVELRISTASGVVRRERQIQHVEAALRELGLRVTIDNAEAGVLRARVEEGDFDIVARPSPGSTFPAARARARYSTDGAQNHTGFSEPGVDEALDAATAEVDPAARRSLLNDVDRLLWEFMPDLPLYQPPAILAHDSTLTGVRFNATSEGHLWNVEAWDRVERGAS